MSYENLNPIRKKKIMNLETIHLFTQNGYWMSKSNDPMIMNLFGTDTLPLPFDSSADSFEVLKHVASKKPLAKLTIES